MVCRFRKYYRCVILHALTINVRELAEAWRVWDKSTTDNYDGQVPAGFIKFASLFSPSRKKSNIVMPRIEKDIASALLPETDRLFEK